MGLGEFATLTQSEREAFYKDRICAPTPTKMAEGIDRVRWFQVVANLEQFSSVLDIGCHDGFVTRWMASAEFPCQVLGIDPCQAAISAAIELGQKEKNPSVLQYFCGTWQDFESKFPGEQYSAVVAFEIIEHFPESEIKELLRFMDRSLAPGGQAFVTTPEIDGPWGKVNPEREHITLFSVNSLVTLLQETLGITPEVEVTNFGLINASWSK